MPSRRDEIKLTEAEQAELLDTERVVIVSSIGPRGWPHSMPMWFTVRDGEIWMLDLRQVAEGQEPRARSAGDAADRDR